MKCAAGVGMQVDIAAWVSSYYWDSEIEDCPVSWLHGAGPQLLERELPKLHKIVTLCRRAVVGVAGRRRGEQNLWSDHLIEVGDSKSATNANRLAPSQQSSVSSNRLTQKNGSLANSVNQKRAADL